MSTALRTAWQLAIESSPIVLTNGIATAMGGAMPIIALTESGSFVQSILSGAGIPGPEQFFARFTPLPGSTLIANQVATYPFANQAVAANAIIVQPKNISLRMTCPAQGTFGYYVKLGVMTALVKTLEQHVNLGGTFSVITPSYIYTDCLLTNLSDFSGMGSNQIQYEYRFDFMQPLLTLQAAQIAASGLLAKIQSGATISGSPTWSSALQVANPVSAFVSGLSSIPQ